ncbi:hypothetical protein PHMEG_00035454 [Phytophthora megakarya]|uniref:Uncharacterized protein n=1 Tax=Phytophthora megakarya TaxID=4795 RepID=A0A225UNP9_9STRA|nr:hypothetical protein PHMEG_00035454 [Phytophthora megakarya]
MSVMGLLRVTDRPIPLLTTTLYSPHGRSSRPRYTPWPRALRDITLSSLTARVLRADHLPPRAWIFPTTAPPAPAFWDLTLLTERAVEALYATRPWDYIARRVQPLTFDVNDRHFQPFLAPGRADMDLLLDVMLLLFPTGRSSVGRWYLDLQNSTLEAALAEVDTREPWRRFFVRSPTLQAFGTYSPQNSSQE